MLDWNINAIILKELQEEVTCGHFVVNIIIQKMLDATYWWVTLFEDVNEFYKTCDVYQ
jgi:hypothetical protein